MAGNACRRGVVKFFYLYRSVVGIKGMYRGGKGGGFSVMGNEAGGIPGLCGHVP